MKTGTRRAAALLAWVTALGCGVVATSAVARHRPHDAHAGQFDFYLLSLSWSPAYCLDRPDAGECRGPRRYGFIVHGLWPQYERGWPENCGGERVPEEVAEGMLDLMPARGLIYHEWSAHGTCSGLEPAAFFASVRRARAAVTIPAAFAQPDTAIQQSPAALAAEFQRANPRFPPHAVVVTCGRGGAPRLREVHVCFSRELVPQTCSADAQRAACQIPSLIVPPIR